MAFSITPDQVEDVRAPAPQAPVKQAPARAHAPRRNPDKPQLEPSQVLAATDIVDLIGEVVELRPRGSNRAEMVGQCPFHGDSHPSFEVNGAKSIYSCWSCSAGLNGSRGGDAITFVRRYHGMGYREALVFLARRAGIPVPDENQRTYSRANAQPARQFVPRTPVAPAEPVKGEPNLQAEKPPLYEAMARAQDVYAAELRKSDGAIKYLFQTRGITPDLLGRYAIGFAPAGFYTLQRHYQDYKTSTLLIDAGLTRESAKGSRYDLFRDRIMFGVRNDEGKVVAFGGRRLSDVDAVDSSGKQIRTPKYLNSPETAVFSKRDEIFGWYEAKESVQKMGYVLVVEGYMDVLGLASQGVENASACMGTALTEGHVQKILATTKNLVFCMDGDKAGQEGAFRSLSGLFPFLDNDVTPTFLTLPDGMDPDEFVKKHGRAEFLKRVQGAKDLPAFWEEALSGLHDIETADGRQRVWRNASALMDLLPEDSRFRPQLTQISNRLSGRRATQGQAQARGRHGATSYVVNEPTDRLCLAVMRLPGVAGGIRPELVRFQQSIPSTLYPALAAWQSRYDQALAAGQSQQGGSLSEAETRQYRAIIEAAPSILAQHLEMVKKDQIETARRAGTLDETTYLSKMQRSSFAKPR